MSRIKDSEVYKEWVKVRSELSAMGEPLRKRENELSRQVDEMYRNARKEKFAAIQGKLFYYENANNGEIGLIKPLSCGDFESEYNSCNVMLVSVVTKKRVYQRAHEVIYFQEDTHRVDDFEKMRLATEEDIEAVKKLMTETMGAMLSKII